MTKIMNRRKWLATAGFAALGACARSKSTGFNGYALVANAGDNSLAAVDLDNFQLSNALDLRASPSRVLAAPDGFAAHQAYILTPANGSVHALDSGLKIARSRRFSDHISLICLHEDGKSLLAVSPHSSELIQADLTTLQPLAPYKLSVPADNLDFSKDGYAAVASSAGALELIHLASGRRTRTQTPKLGQVRFRSDGKLLLAANLQNRSLLVLDVPSLQVVAELPLAMMPEQLCFNADHGQLFITGEGMDGVAVVFPFNTLEVDQTLLAGRDPGVMACSGGAYAYLFVGSRTGSDLCLLNIYTRKVIGFVETGGRPTFITVTPDSRYALVLDQDKGDMGVIRVPGDLKADARRLKTGASLFTMISVGSKPVDAVVISKA
jgi:WD40 repeat protein